MTNSTSTSCVTAMTMWVGSRQLISIIREVAVRATFLSEALHNINESSVVLETSLGTSCLRLLLILFVNLWGLSLHLTSTCEGTVNLTSGKSTMDIEAATFFKLSKSSII